MKFVPQILSYTYKKERSVAFKIRQNPFRAVAPPPTPLEELTTLPQTLVGLGGDTLPKPHHTRHRPIFGARSPCVPPEFQPDLCLCLVVWRHNNSTVYRGVRKFTFARIPSSNSYSHSRGLYHSHGLPMSRMRVGYSHSSCRHLVADCARFITKPFARLSVLE